MRENEENVLMYKMFVDDMYMMLRRRSLVINDEVELADKMNVDFVAQVANRLHHSIHVTTNYPTKNVNNKMLILDLSV